MTKQPRSVKKRTTHRIQFHNSGVSSFGWNWRIIAANGEIIAYSNQGHARKIDARAAVRNFLAAVRAGSVEVKA